MSELDIWVAITKQVSPNDLYVKIDGSNFYTAYWVVLSKSEERAQSLVIETSGELVLGETEILTLSLYDDGSQVHDEIITERARSLIEKLPDHEDAQISAWVSSNGGLW